MMEIKVKYMAGVAEIWQAHPGEWYDLRAAESIYFRRGDFRKIPLGVAMELPKGYEAHVVPRSSTFEKYGIIMTNSFGVIDNKYCGDNDFWSFPAYAVRDTWVMKNERICQFRLVEQQPEVTFRRVDKLGNDDRKGFGSSGRV